MPVNSNPGRDGNTNTSFECDRCGKWYLAINSTSFQDAFVSYAPIDVEGVVTFLQVHNDESIYPYISEDDDSNIFLCEECTQDFKRFIDGNYVTSMSMGQANRIGLPEIVERYKDHE